MADRRTQVAAGGLLAAAAAGVAGKAALERGDGSGGPSGPSRAYRLKAKEQPSEGIVRIAAGRAETALDDLRRAAAGDDVAGSVHSARKELKKLRSLLRMVRPALGEEAFRSQNRLYGNAGRRLAATRDAKVKLDTLAALEKRFGGELPNDAVEAWRRSLVHEHEELCAERGLANDLERAIGDIEDGLRQMSGRSLPDADWELFRPGIERSYRRGRRAMRRARSQHGAEDIHEWRKRVKDLAYQQRVVKTMWPKLVGEAAEQAHALADLLGDHHDLTVLHDDLTARGSLDGRKAISAAIERRQAEILADALALGTRVYAETPKRFSRRLGAYWDAWRVELAHR